MPKKLSEMTLEELWCLFPVILTKPNPEWKAWYTEESEILLSILPRPRWIYQSEIRHGHPIYAESQTGI